MSNKVAIWASIGLVVAGTATWFFFLRKRNALTAEDRANMQQYEPVEDKSGVIPAGTDY